jgi:hypothetical protein
MLRYLTLPQVSQLVQYALAVSFRATPSGDRRVRDRPEAFPGGLVDEHEARNAAARWQAGAAVTFSDQPASHLTPAVISVGPTFRMQKCAHQVV